MAQKLSIPIRCVHFTAPTKLCEHNDTVRALTDERFNPENRSILPHSAFAGFASRFKEPKVKEGFQDIVTVEFQVLLQLPLICGTAGSQGSCFSSKVMTSSVEYGVNTGSKVVRSGLPRGPQSSQLDFSSSLCRQSDWIKCPEGTNRVKGLPQLPNLVPAVFNGFSRSQSSAEGLRTRRLTAGVISVTRDDEMTKLGPYDKIQRDGADR